MTPSEKLVGVADETMSKPEVAMFNLQVEVENFKFLVDIVVMDMAECPMTLGRHFLAIGKARINLENNEIVLMSKGKYLIHIFHRRTLGKMPVLNAMQ